MNKTIINKTSINKTSPKISVLMSVYNGSNYLRESIESIINQTFSDFEFIIINDSSTDNTGEIISEYAQKDDRIKVFNNEENIGLTKSLNKGLNFARGEYIARQDADDVSLAQRFERQVAVLDRNPEAVLISCELEVINSEGAFVKKEERSCDPQLVPWYLMFYNHIGGHSQVIFRAKTARELGGYSEAHRYSQDYEFWCRLAKTGDIIILPEVLHQLRRHGKGITAEKRSEQLGYALDVSRNNIKELIGQELSLDEVSDLRHFWSGHVLRNFPRNPNINTMHLRLQEISQAFLNKKNIYYGKPGDNLDNSLYRLIGLQFIYWIQFLSIVRYLPLRLKISLYALKWNPIVGIISCWLKDFYKQPLAILGRKLITINKKYNQKLCKS